MSLYNLRDAGGADHTKTTASPEPSCVSVNPPKFSDDGTTSDPSSERDYLMSALQTHTQLEETRDLQQDSRKPIDDVLQRVKDTHKTRMKNKYESLSEGIKLQENKTLYIIEGESEGVNEEHEVLQMEKTPRRQHLQDTSINCNDIFYSVPEPECEERSKLKTVLTKGIAGIGKTVSVQRFILDWSEGKANQEVDFMFVLPFRELNLIKDEQYSLHKLLIDFHPELHNLDTNICDECKVVFIFDGLDESGITLMFSDTEKVSKVTQTSSVGVLITNLIKGELLPSAFIWITSRPAAVKQIPSEYINRLTEILGFNDPQKEEYFRKRISDQHQASRIISHIKTVRSLDIMCHIPVFCWISATVLQKILSKDHKAIIPKTLTEMYIHFLLIQINMRNQKYEERDERSSKKVQQSNREVILKLAKLAFKQLMKGNVMFYEEDLRECGIDFTEASVFSGICTEIFKEESVIYQRKVYCFVHLSFQEFLAAFHVFHSHVVKNRKLLQILDIKFERYTGDIPLYEVLEAAVKNSLKSENGHLDLFLRFLLGISLESNQRLLRGLLTHIEKNPNAIPKTIKHIRNKIRGVERLTAGRCINLFLCLLEMNDQTLYREIQSLKSEEHSVKKLSPSHCSAIAYMLQISEEVMDELDPKKYNTTLEGRRRLIPAVMNCRKALLAGCYLNDGCCESLASVLQSSDSPLRELDLSNNDLQDSRGKLLAAGMSPRCQLEILRMATCNLLDNVCESVASVLQSSDSHLRELDMSNSKVRDVGVKLLSAGLKSPHCQLKILRLSGCMVTEEGCSHLASALRSNPSHLRELDLSYNHPGDSGVKLISAGLEDPNCIMEKLKIADCYLTDQCCESLALALQSSDSSLRELELSNNDLQDSGMKLLSVGLRSSHCRLEILRLSGCMVTEEGCSHLASALRSNPSHLRELDLSYNHPGDSGVKLISARLEDPNCTLKKISVDHGGEFRIAAGLQKYACNLTLDPNTVNYHLFLSEKNRKVTWVREKQSYPDHPERFELYEQVLCRESLTERCYWEVELSEWKAEISVAFKGISRKGGWYNCQFGSNEKSCSLRCFRNRFTVYHNKTFTTIPAISCSSKRIALYLDLLAGTLTFFSISDTHKLTRLYTVYSTFTEPLHAGFTVYSNCSVSLCPVRNNRDIKNS